MVLNIESSDERCKVRESANKHSKRLNKLYRTYSFAAKTTQERRVCTD
jgi:hypothetical protein